MHRRGFLVGCAAAAAAADGAALIEAAEAAAAAATPHAYPRAQLVGTDGRPLRAAEVPVRRNLLFRYPYQATPAFLLNLGKPTRRDVALSTSRRERYTWDGGVGPQRSIVAFSAICAHRMAYPTREISFISYRDEPSPVSGRGQVIHCCSEHSQYDPADGARVLAGPATQPLAAILLEHDPASDALFAVGTLGGELFDAFFGSFAMRLSLEYGSRARDPVGATTAVQPIESYCRQLMRCA
ncbi:MAG: (2Fe-2S)-binding protein [Burkholderiaceae bacterium]|nr:(2Fe-2S)-binding protein [Burkholderiaceae bacterium]